MLNENNKNQILKNNANRNCVNVSNKMIFTNIFKKWRVKLNGFGGHFCHTVEMKRKNTHVCYDFIFIFISSNVCTKYC